MIEHYDLETLAVSRQLYDNIRVWAQRGGVTLIGGWAVFERVKPDVAQQSRDVDLIIHDKETLMDFDRQLSGWNLKWRTHGRNRFNDCHLRDDFSKQTRVDIFKDSSFHEPVFKGMAMRGANIVKKAPCTSWLPDVEYLVRDKLTTIPQRRRDRQDKRLKDLVDVHALVYHNEEGITPATLADDIAHLRHSVLDHLLAAREFDATERRGDYAERLEELAEWLNR